MSRVLIVDDEPGIVNVLSRILEKAGHTISKATRAADAIRLVEQAPIDIALVDHMLEDVDGLSVLRAIWARQPECGRILMSGRLDLPLVMEAVNAGCVHHVLQKPASGQELHQAIAAVAGRKEQLADDWRRIQDRERKAERDMLADCLAGDLLQLALQPILAMEGKGLMACEALLRSSHPVLSNPLLLLEAAERCDMLSELGAVVARRAAAWMPLLPPGTDLFVNLHPEELRNPERLLAQLAPLLPWAGRVVLEITEHSQMRPGPEWITAIQSLRARGFAIAVDDLGAGYNSLGVLASLQPDYIKVDMGIVRDVDFDPYKQRLIGLLVQLAEGTGSTLIAEGVETAAEAEALRGLGVHLVQGYLFGRPSLQPDFARHASAHADLRQKKSA